MGRCMEGIGMTSTIIYQTQDHVDIDVDGAGIVGICDNGAYELEIVYLGREDAIAAARAILKHFNCGMEE